MSRRNEYNEPCEKTEAMRALGKDREMGVGNENEVRAPRRNEPLTSYSSPNDSPFQKESSPSGNQ